MRRKRKEMKLLEMEVVMESRQEEQVFHTVCRDCRLMGVCEQNRGKGLTAPLCNGSTLVLF